MTALAKMRAPPARPATVRAIVSNPPLLVPGPHHQDRGGSDPPTRASCPLKNNETTGPGDILPRIGGTVPLPLYFPSTESRKSGMEGHRHSRRRLGALV